MIAVINYGVSNIGSMLNMLKKLGVAAKPVTTPDEIEQADKIILPGIGAFDHGMTALNDLALAEPLKRRVLHDRVPLLGVCLGMQMMAGGSEEGSLEGLSLLDGYCARFRTDGERPIKVPHMGWNELLLRQSDPLVGGLDGSRFYFVHSYHFVCRNSSDVLASARHGVEFTAAVHRDNVWGVQFHPEKSHRFGMTLLRNFAAI